MNAVADYEALDGFYRAKEGGETVPWRSSGVLQCFHFGKKRGRDSARLRRGKEHAR
jgi:hypothetical protein